MFGFVKFSAAAPIVTVANCSNNAKGIIDILLQANNQGISLLCFPELCITGATCQDLFFQRSLIENAEKALLEIASASASLSTIAIVGAPLLHNNKLYNCAVIIGAGKIWGAVPKTYLPNHSESAESRWFSSAENLKADEVVLIGSEKVSLSSQQLFTTPQFTFAIAFGSDICAPISPLHQLSFAGADVICSPSAFAESVGHHENLRSLLLAQSKLSETAIICASASYGESTQDIVLSGKLFITELNELLAEGKRFMRTSQFVTADIDIERIRHKRLTNSIYKQSADLNHTTVFKQTHIFVEPQTDNATLLRAYPKLPFIPTDANVRKERCEEILNIQVEGLMKRLTHTHCSKAVIGISGGLDSTLALLVTVRAFDALKFDRQNIFGITMPGFGTTDRTYTNALNLMKLLGITTLEIPIAPAVMQHFADIGHDPAVHDVTYENSQARERTQILMDFANARGAMVIGTGDLSELALGWATYNGDHMSMYGINASIPKTLVKHLVIHEATEITDKVVCDILLDVVNTPISPELIPAATDGTIKQKTEDLVGPYELHDFFLYHTLRNGFTPEKIRFIARHTFADTYDGPTITHWLNTFTRRFFQQQFKRSCMPDGPKVGTCTLSPRGDWRMPTDADRSHWKL